MAMTVRICAVTAAVLLIASFAMFAIDQLQEGSATQVSAVDKRAALPVSEGPLDQPSPSAAVERAREAAHSTAREVLDDANDLLVSPFAGIVTSRDPWGPRMVSGGLALLLFGLGGMLLANVLPQPRHKVGDWREATS
jgi:hypothetical protein